ncbi:MAG: WD40 repeat domain-containing protein [Polyangiaceae bacterium]
MRLVTRSGLALLFVGCGAPTRAPEPATASASQGPSAASSTPAALPPPRAMAELRTQAPRAYTGAYLREDGRGVTTWYADDIGARPVVQTWELSDSGVSVRALPTGGLMSQTQICFGAGFFWASSSKALWGVFSNDLAVWSASGDMLFSDPWPEALADFNPRTELVLIADQVGSAAVRTTTQSTWRPKQTLYRLVTGATHDVVWLNDEVGAVVYSGNVALMLAKDGSNARTLGVDSADTPVVAGSVQAFAVGASDGELILIDSRTLKTTHTLSAGAPRTPRAPSSPSPNQVVALGFSPDGKSLAADRLDGTLEVWEVATGKRTHRFKADEHCARWNAVTRAEITWSPRGADFACVGVDASLVFSLDKDGVRIADKTLPRGLVGWADGGARLVVMTGDGQLVDWYPETRQTSEARIALQPDQGFRPSTNPGFDYRAGYYDGDFRVERTSDGAALRLRADEEGSHWVVFDDDGDFQGDASACQTVLKRVSPSGVESPPTADDCRAHERPDLVARFYSGK